MKNIHWAALVSSVLLMLLGDGGTAAVEAQTTVDPLAGTVGGPGGRFYATRCPDNQMLVGVAGRSGTVIDQIAPVCVAFDRHDRWIGEPVVGGAEGGKGGGPFMTVCPRNTLVTGFTSVGGEFVVNIRLQCQFPLRRGEAVPPPPPVGGSLHLGSNAGAQCRDRQVASGIRGMASHFVNRFGISCNVSYLEPPQKALPRPGEIPGKIYYPPKPDR
jgi:hypothetical protein